MGAANDRFTRASRTAMFHLAALPLIAAPLVSCTSPEEMDWTGVLDEDSFAALHDLKEGDAPELMGEDVEVADMSCYLARPERGEPLGAVIVIHEWWGLNDHVKHWADRLASDGYVALAVDLYGGVVATNREEAIEAMKGVEDEDAIAKMRGAHEWLVDGEGPVKAERTACVGWCFGGGRSLQLAIAEPDLDAAVIYYGRLVTDAEQLGAIEAPVLGIFGDDDTGIPPEAVKEFADAMEAAGKSLEVRSYDAGHAFANPSGARYDAEHAAAAWRETRAFLAEHLWPEPPGGSLTDGSRELQEDVPDGWSEGRESRMRISSYSVAGSTDCGVFAFGNGGGGLRANFDRWSNQLGADPLTDDEIDELAHIPVLGSLTPIFRAQGSFKGMGGDTVDDATMLAIFVPVTPGEDEGDVLCVKLLGPTAEVEEAAEDFVAYCRGLR